MHDDQHEAFRAPTNADISIWRYMDLPKFVSMLEAEALHFARSDQMSDNFEGSITKVDLQVRHMHATHLRNLGMPAEGSQKLLDRWAFMGEQERSHVYLSCWHMNEHESAAMWSMYQSGQPQGIAVRSTYRRLSESITDRRTIYIGEVSYVDFDHEQIPRGITFYPFVYKRKSFEHERELRALYWTLPDEDLSKEDPEHPGFFLRPVGPPVIEIEMDLDRLVEAVYVSPKALPWFAELVGKVLSRYGRDWPVHHSDLDADPIF